MSRLLKRDTRLSVHDAASDPEWDTFVDSCPGGHHTQTSMWSQVKAGTGWSAVRLRLHVEDRLVGGVQLLVRRILGVGGVGYVPRGPLLRPDDLEEHAALLIDALRSLAKRRMLLFIKVQPPDGREDIGRMLAQHDFARSELATTSEATVRLDLTRDLDDILQRMSKSTRYDVRRATRVGITVRDGTQGELPLFHELLTATAARQGGFDVYPRAYYERMWRFFAPRGHARLLIAEHDRVPLSAAFLIAYNDTVLRKASGWSGERNDLRVNPALHWAAIQWGKAQGYRWYDFDGIDGALARALIRGDSKTVPDGVASFKLSFGGEVELFPSAWDWSPLPGMSRLLPSLEEARTAKLLVRRLIGRRGFHRVVADSPSATAA